MNILFLTHRVPYPPNRGDRIRAYHLLRFLSSKHQVSLACLADEEFEPETYSILKGLTKRLEIVRQSKIKRWGLAALCFGLGGTATSGLFHESKLIKVLERWKAETKFDCIIAFCSSMAPYAFALGNQKIPVLVDLVDVDSQKWLDYAKQAAGPKRLLYKTEGNRLRKFEKEIAKKATGVALVSELEADIYQGICANDQTHAIINGVDCQYFADSGESVSPQPFSCVFVGALDYGANIDALQWFCKEVWPLVREDHHQAQLTMVGRNPTHAIKKLATLPGLNLAADVPDVRPYLSKSEVAIAPLRIARGIQNKVLEAMAMSKPVIASREALAGIHLQSEVHAIEANSPQEWRTALTKLWGSSECRLSLGSAAREYVQEHHIWDVTLQKWTSLLAGCKADAGRHAAKIHLSDEQPALTDK